MSTDDAFFNDGWDDDVDDLDLEDDNNNVDGGETSLFQEAVSAPHAPPQLQPPTSSSAQPPASSSHVVSEEGWSDDVDDLDFGEEEEEEISEGLNTTEPQGHAAGTSTVNQQQQQQSHHHHCTPQQQQKLYEDVEAYLQLLPHLQTSVNAVFDVEYNVSEQQAYDIFQYYQERPGLLDYTLEKELPRMEYTIILRSNASDGGQRTVLQNKTPETTMAVADCLRRHALQNTSGGPAHVVLPRAANQSLLADCLQVLTGPDRVIRPHYMATAVATSCHFVVDLGSSDQQHHDDDHHHLLGPPPSVRVTAELALSLPTPTGRWKVADMTVVAQLIVPPPPANNHREPAPPAIEYRLSSIRPVPVDDAWRQNLKSAVAMLAELNMDHHQPGSMMQQQEINEGAASTTSSHLHYRDAFLQQSQALLLWENSMAAAVGMKSVLQDIDKVSGISQKLAALPQLLPSTDLDYLAAVEQEEAQAAAEHERLQRMRRQQQQQQQQQQQHASPSFPRPQPHPSQKGPAAPFPRPSQQSQQQLRPPPPPPPSQQQQRPTSILGGMFGKLAQAVALPEEDPDMYRDWQASPAPQQPQRPMMMSPPGAPSSGPPHLYHREPATQAPPPSAPFVAAATPLGGPPPPQPEVGVRSTQPPPPPRAAEPVRDEITEVIDDGWDDDDDGDVFSTTENSDNVEDLVDSAVTSTAIESQVAARSFSVPNTTAREQQQATVVDHHHATPVDRQPSVSHEVVSPPPPPPPPARTPCSEPAQHVGIVHELEEDADWVYNPEDDCLPTRKRWKNPRPGPRQLASFSTTTTPNRNNASFELWTRR